jgi:hypothetical protein
MDATFVETNKKDALHCYKGYKAYQPLNTYWAEQELMVHSEFRDGNVPAGFEQHRVFNEALEVLPDGVENVFLRSDTVGYQHDLLKYCAEDKNEGFGVIEFAIGAYVPRNLKRLCWKFLRTSGYHCEIFRNSRKCVLFLTGWPVTNMVLVIFT